MSFDTGDTQPLPPIEDDYTSNELSLSEKISRAVTLASLDLEISDSSNQDIQRVSQIIEENWSVFELLIRGRGPSDYDTEAMKSFLSLFILTSQSEGLDVLIVDKAQMPDQGSLDKDNNYGQLDINDDRWILKLDKETLLRKINSGDRAVMDELAHEYFAWKLFSEGSDKPTMQSKVTKNLRIPTNDGSILQTHFFDVFFDKLVFISR